LLTALTRFHAFRALDSACLISPFMRGRHLCRREVNYFLLPENRSSVVLPSLHHFKCIPHHRLLFDISSNKKILIEDMDYYSLVKSELVNNYSMLESCLLSLYYL
jgi:hypothetical protein